MTLLGELIVKLIDTKNNPKILMRRNESVVEKMLTNWFAFLLYDFIRDCAGTPLYILFLSIKQQIYKGPVDALTCEARYSLSEDKLIRQSVDYETICVRVRLQDFDFDAESGLLCSELNVKVLSCDTITQVKEKLLDAFFKGTPYSKRPSLNDLDLVYIPVASPNRLILYDEDKTCKLDHDDYKRLNTLSHYKIANGALLLLVSRQAYQIVQGNGNTNANNSTADPCNSYAMLDVTAHNKNAENMTLLSKSSKGSSSPPTYSKLSAHDYTNLGGVYSGMNSSTVGLTESILSSQNQTNSTRLNSNYMISKNVNNNSSVITNNNNAKIKKYHLIKPNDANNTTTPNLKVFCINPKFHFKKAVSFEIFMKYSC